MTHSQYAIDRHSDRVSGGNTFTPEQLQRVFRRQGYRCVRCGRKRPLTIDHIIPTSKRGPNLLLNVQGLCDECNKAKGQQVHDYRNERFATLRRFYRRYQQRDTNTRPTRTSMRGILMKFVAKSFLLLAVLLGGVFLLPGGSLLAASVAASAWSSLLALLLTSQVLGALVALAAVLALALHARDRREMIYPDEFGRLPVAKGELLDRPQIAAATWQAAHVRDYERAIRHGPTHFSYAPKWPTTKGAEELASGALPDLQLPLGVRVSDVNHEVPAGHIAYGHQVQNGAVTLCTVPFGTAFHSLWHGRTRSGKTNGINAMIYWLHMLAQQRPIQLYGADYKMQLLASWERSPLFVEGIQAEIADIAELLDEWVHGPDGVRARSKLFLQASRETGRIVDNWEKYEDITGQKLPLKVLIFDEVNSTMEEADKLKIKTLEPDFKQALQMGAGNGMFLFSGTQRITGVVGPDSREQFVTRAHFGHYDNAIILALYGKLHNHDELRRYVDGTQGRGVIQTIMHAAPVPLQALKCDEQDILDAIRGIQRPVLSDEQEAQKSALETPGSGISAYEDTSQTAHNGTPSISASNAYTAYGGGEISEQERRDILLAASVKVNGKPPSRRAVCRAVYDTDGGPPYQKVKAVLDEAGL